MTRTPSEQKRTAMTVLGGLLVVSLIGMAVGAGRMMGYDPNRGPSGALLGQPAPEVSLPVVSGEGALEGDRVSVAALRGRVVLLDFWASWCGPCRQSIPVLNRIHARYGDRIEMIGVNVENGVAPSRIQDAHRSFGASFRSVQDQQSAAQSQYFVTSIPTLVLIDQSGAVRWSQSGVPDEDDLADRIDELLDP